MSTLSEHLKYSINGKDNVNESLILGAIVATACVGYAAGPMLKNEFFQSLGAGLGNLLSGFGSMFAGIGAKAANSGGDKSKGDDKKSEEDGGKGEDKEKPTNTGDDGSTDKDVINTFSKDPKAQAKLSSGLLLMAKKANDSEKDETKKKETDSMIKLITACSFDKDGNEIPMEERLNKMKDIVPEEQFEEFKDKLNKAYEDNKDSKEFKEALEKAKGEISEKDIEEYENSAKEEAKKSWKEIEESKAKQKEMDEEIAKLEKELESAEGDDKEKLEKDIQAAQAKKEEATQQSFIGKLGSALGIKPKGDTTKDDTTKDDTTKDDTTKDDTTKDDTTKDDTTKDDTTKDDTTKDDTTKDDTTKDDTTKDDTTKDDTTKDDTTKDDTTKDDTTKDDTTKDDTGEEKDEEGNIVKDEEITDPETGKKIKVKTHTGPRGGKFYYPDGKPKTPENKVYLESKQYNGFSNYLMSIFS
jgi:hypothetical protein